MSLVSMRIAGYVFNDGLVMNQVKKDFMNYEVEDLENGDFTITGDLRLLSCASDKYGKEWTFMYDDQITEGYNEAIGKDKKYYADKYNISKHIYFERGKDFNFLTLDTIDLLVKNGKRAFTGEEINEIICSHGRFGQLVKWCKMEEV